MDISTGVSPEDHSARDHISHIDEERKVRQGMLFYVVTDILFALFLLTAYVFLRVSNINGNWFPSGTPNISFIQPTIFMIILVASGVCYAIGQYGVSHDNQGLLRIGVTLAAILWLVALGCQFWYMGHLPFITQDGSFASTYITLTGYHLFHLLLGLPLLIGITVRSWQGRYSAQKSLGPTVIGYFWYWAVILGVIIWLLPLILPAKI